MQIKSGLPYPLGVFKTENEIHFALESDSKNDCGILLYSETEEVKVPFKRENKCGNVFYGKICNAKSILKYKLYDGDRIYLDEYARHVMGNEEYASLKELQAVNQLAGQLEQQEFDWENDKRLCISYNASIFYHIHVRGFTKHSSSKVKAKGTFRGIVEKIPYLKELGITGIELMPCYEFLESIEESKELSAIYQKEENNRVNYWGYKKGFYFSPKASYASGTDAVLEMKEMIKELHKNGIEVIMQFYFPKEIRQNLQLEILRHWVFQYHIDGIHVLGESIAIGEIIRDPLLCETKIFFQGFDMTAVANKSLAVCTDEFMYIMRKFLKGDEDMLTSFLNAMRTNPKEYAVINYMTNYYGFTLQDLVSYDRKHNEENGEDNKDGNDYNFSWNCGAEGVTRKKSILKLRSKQVKNAMMFLMLAQGTPMILSGDEFLNTQNGNNNAYCQDNETGWLNWNKLKTNGEFFVFVKKLISLRKQNSIQSEVSNLKVIDTMAGGYPDFSYHGKEAWRPAMENYNRHVGILHSAKEQFYYVTFNMHWIGHHFALPKLPADYRWQLFADTGREDSFLEKMELLSNQQQVEASERSVQIYIGVRLSGNENLETL